MTFKKWADIKHKRPRWRLTADHTPWEWMLGARVVVALGYLGISLHAGPWRVRLYRQFYRLTK